MKKLLVIATIFSTFMLSNSVYADYSDCNTVSQGKIDRTSKMEKGGIEGRYDYFVDFSFPKGSEEITVYDKEGGCNEYQGGALSITCLGGNHTTKLNGKVIAELPEAYDAEKNVIYITQESYKDPQEDYNSDRGTRSVISCSNQSSKYIDNSENKSIITDDLLQIAETSVEPALYTQVSQKEYNKFKNSTVSEIAKKLGLNRKKDRSAIALSAGIKNYTRTRDQNMIIKTMLLKQFVITKTEKQQQQEEITTYMKQYVDAMKPIEVTKKEFNELKNSTLFDIMKKAGMDWRKNRKDIAAALGVKNYKGTRSQNMTIRSAILKMFIVK